MLFHCCSYEKKNFTPTSTELAKLILDGFFQDETLDDRGKGKSVVDDTTLGVEDDDFAENTFDGGCSSKENVHAKVTEESEDG
ncbi:uncharacterized protein LOC133829210 isoform X2 [Humulus lupulus]|uniref:uncharacterized protein LOC133829210 isoform X2 n=1 Tax=Humulus lupulus TaxID=3486 RepID=UPI002B406B1D|nr:uncharacterized protein LOC133829210 isoform X2 [Humulus lupulus]